DGVPVAVVQAGYRAGRMWIRARGEVHAAGGGQVFRIAGTEMDLSLLGQKPAGDVLEARVEFRPEAVLVPEPAPRHEGS
ncbi:MAG: hypothetical protein ABIP94_06735, partial [Planctomycetota bacterium]